MEALRQMLVGRQFSSADSISDISSGMRSDTEMLQDGAREDSPDARGATRDLLMRAIEDAVVPRLLVAHGAKIAAADIEPVPREPNEEDVAKLSALILAHDSGAVASLIRRLRRTGSSVDMLCLELLAPTARYLGDLWVRDACGFTEVTIGLLQLHDVLRVLCLDDTSAELPRVKANQILLVLTPGDQHMFGLSMVAEFFRKAGWNVQIGYPENAVELGRIVSADHFNVVGLSCGSEARMDAAASAIRVIRRGAICDGVVVMVGGPVFIAHPELAPAIGADMTATDGRDAVHRADRFCADRAALR